jgi:hypothetical protein
MKVKMFSCVAGDGESGGADEDGGVSGEAAGEDDEVSCHRDCVPAPSNVDMLCSCSTKFPIILAILVTSVYVEDHNSVTHQCML